MFFFPSLAFKKPPLSKTPSGTLRPKFKKPATKDVKRSFSHQLSRSPHVHLATLALVLVAMVLLAVCNVWVVWVPTFTVGLPALLQVFSSASFTFAGLNQQIALHPQWLSSYTPTIPVALAFAALLGSKAGHWPLLGLLGLAGVGLPVLAWGGLESWLHLPVAGFWLGLLLASWLVAWLSPAWLRPGSPWWLAALVLLGISLVCVGLTHGVAMLALGGWAAFKHLSWEQTQQWVSHTSSTRLGYDVLLTVVLLACIKPVRALLWLLLY
jgi:biotin transporter BioY